MQSTKSRATQTGAETARQALMTREEPAMAETPPLHDDVVENLPTGARHDRVLGGARSTQPMSDRTDRHPETQAQMGLRARVSRDHNPTHDGRGSPNAGKDGEEVSGGGRKRGRERSHDGRGSGFTTKEITPIPPLTLPFYLFSFYYPCPTPNSRSPLSQRMQVWPGSTHPSALPLLG